MVKTTLVSWEDFFNPVQERERSLYPSESLSETNSKISGYRRSSYKRLLKNTAKGASLAVLICTSAMTFAPVVVSSVSSLGVITSSILGTGIVHASGGSIAVAVAPVTAVVTESVGWSALIAKVLVIVDYLMDGVIIFSGVSWMFGNRTKAIELLLGAGVGYVIVRHHEDIKNFFAVL